MPAPGHDEVDALKRKWTDTRVRVKPGSRPELARFEGRIGRVVTVNYSGRAVVDFATGGWHDVATFQDVLEIVTDPAEIEKYDPTVNSAQRLPARQG